MQNENHRPVTLCYTPNYANNQPVLTDRSNEYSAGRGISIEIDKEWIKKLLAEFAKQSNDLSEQDYFLEEFLDKSEIWNGK